MSVLLRSEYAWQHPIIVVLPLRVNGKAAKKSWGQIFTGSMDYLLRSFSLPTKPVLSSFFRYNISTAKVKGNLPVIQHFKDY